MRCFDTKWWLKMANKLGRDIGLIRQYDNVCFFFKFK